MAVHRTRAQGMHGCLQNHAENLPRQSAEPENLLWQSAEPENISVVVWPEVLAVCKIKKTCYGCLQNQRTKEQTVIICWTREQATTVCRTKEQAMAARRTEHMLDICLKNQRTCYGCLQNQKTCYGCLQNEPTWPWAKSVVFSVSIWIVCLKNKKNKKEPKMTIHFRLYFCV